MLVLINDLISDQLSRGASSGHVLFSAPIDSEPHAQQLVRSLEKVYAGKGVLCEFDVAEGSQFLGEPGDLQELLGNLLENAFKWARSRVLLTVRSEEHTSELQSLMRISYAVFCLKKKNNTKQPHVSVTEKTTNQQ